MRRRRRFHIGQTVGVQEAFGPVLFGVMIVGTLIAVLTFASARSSYDDIGKGGLNDGTDRPAHEPMTGAGADAMRDEEVRQMLEAKNARRVRRGLEPLDVEQELAALIRPAASKADPALEAEVRDLVRARNARRARKGQEPLDVEAEVARQLADFS